MRSTFEDMAAECGPSRVGHAYSRLLVEVSEISPTTPIGRLALNETLKGLCPDPGEGDWLTLDRDAEIVCAGR